MDALEKLLQLKGILTGFWDLHKIVIANCPSHWQTVKIIRHKFWPFMFPREHGYYYLLYDLYFASRWRPIPEKCRDGVYLSWLDIMISPGVVWRSGQGYCNAYLETQPTWLMQWAHLPSSHGMRVVWNDFTVFISSLQWSAFPNVTDH